MREGFRVSCQSNGVKRWINSRSFGKSIGSRDLDVFRSLAQPDSRSKHISGHIQSQRQEQQEGEKERKGCRSDFQRRYSFLEERLGDGLECAPHRLIFLFLAEKCAILVRRERGEKGCSKNKKNDPQLVDLKGCKRSGKKEPFSFLLLLNVSILLTQKEQDWGERKHA